MKAPLPLDSVFAVEFPRLCRAVVTEHRSCVYPWNATYLPHVWHSCHRVHSHVSPRTRGRRRTQPRSLRTRRSCRDPAGRRSLLPSLRHTHTNNRLSASRRLVEAIIAASSKPWHQTALDTIQGYAARVTQSMPNRSLMPLSPGSARRQRASFSASCGQRSGLGCPSED